LAGLAAKDAPAIIDIRSQAEYNNTSKNYWQNIGQIGGSINIPATEISKSDALPHSKKRPILLYAFHAQPELFTAAKTLVDRGYKNVSVLVPGIWGIRWQAHNVSGKDDLSKMVINVPPENQ
jgi:rhodanese-related sulfurtransferase